LPAFPKEVKKKRGAIEKRIEKGLWKVWNGFDQGQGRVAGPVDKRVEVANSFLKWGTKGEKAYTDGR